MKEERKDRDIKAGKGGQEWGGGGGAENDINMETKEGGDTWCGDREGCCKNRGRKNRPVHETEQRQRQSRRGGTDINAVLKRNIHTAVSNKKIWVYSL